MIKLGLASWAWVYNLVVSAYAYIVVPTSTEYVCVRARAHVSGQGHKPKRRQLFTQEYVLCFAVVYD